MQRRNKFGQSQIKQEKFEDINNQQQVQASLVQANSQSNKLKQSVYIQ